MSEDYSDMSNEELEKHLAKGQESIMSDIRRLLHARDNYAYFVGHAASYWWACTNDVSPECKRRLQAEHMSLEHITDMQRVEIYPEDPINPTGKQRAYHIAKVLIPDANPEEFWGDLLGDVAEDLVHPRRFAIGFIEGLMKYIPESEVT